MYVYYVVQIILKYFSKIVNNINQFIILISFKKCGARVPRKPVNIGKLDMIFLEKLTITSNK